MKPDRYILRISFYAALVLGIFLLLVGLSACEVTHVIGFFAVWLSTMALFGHYTDGYWNRAPLGMRIAMFAIVYIVPALVAILAADHLFVFICEID